MEHLVHRTKILLGAVYSLIDMHAIDEIAPAFGEYCDKLAIALEDFTDESFTRGELIRYSFESVLAEAKREVNPRSHADQEAIDQLEKMWQERVRNEKKARDKYLSDLMGDDENG